MHNKVVKALSMIYQNTFLNKSIILSIQPGPGKGQILCAFQNIFCIPMFMPTIFLSPFFGLLTYTNLNILMGAKQLALTLFLFVGFALCVFDDSLHYAI